MLNEKCVVNNHGLTAKMELSVCIRKVPCFMQLLFFLGVFVKLFVGLCHETFKKLGRNSECSKFDNLKKLSVVAYERVWIEHRLRAHSKIVRNIYLNSVQFGFLCKIAKMSITRSYYLNEVSKTRQYRILSLLLINPFPQVSRSPVKYETRTRFASTETALGL